MSTTQQITTGAKAEAASMAYAELPQDITFHVLKELPILDILRWSTTCKTFHTQILTEKTSSFQVFWRALVKRDFPHTFPYAENANALSVYCHRHMFNRNLVKGNYIPGAFQLSSCNPISYLVAQGKIFLTNQNDATIEIYDLENVLKWVNLMLNLFIIICVD